MYKIFEYKRESIWVKLAWSMSNAYFSCYKRNVYQIKFLIVYHASLNVVPCFFTFCSRDRSLTFCYSFCIWARCPCRLHSLITLECILMYIIFLNKWLSDSNLYAIGSYWYVSLNGIAQMQCCKHSQFLLYWVLFDTVSSQHCLP